MKQSDELKEENRMKRNKELENKMNQRQQLQFSLDGQIKMKENKLKQEREIDLNENKDNDKQKQKERDNSKNDTNVFREPIKREEMCSCNECHKKYAKRFIFPKTEYYRLLNQKQMK